MAYNLIGFIYFIGSNEIQQTKTGATITHRKLILEQKRFDRNTGQPFRSAYIQLEFTDNNCSKLDGFKTGDLVDVSFDLSGYLYPDKQTGEEKNITTLRAFGIRYYKQTQQPVQQSVQQPVQQQPVVRQAVQQQPNPTATYQQPAQSQQQPLPFD